MIKVENLNKSFGQVKAVDNLSFEIKTGEVVGLLGPNGAGKTTTMRLITGFLSPDSGAIQANNVSVTQDPLIAQSHIGYLPENNPLYPEMLVSEILQLTADLKRIPSQNRKIAFDFAVEACGINNVFYRPIKELSKGFKQRVGIACCILSRPSILIMDEPTEGLDPNQRAEIRQLIKKLSKNRTIIISTHVMQEALAVSSRLLIIANGKLAADGSVEELSSASKNEKIITLDVEGKEIEKQLKTINNVKLEKLEKISDKRMKAKLICPSDMALQIDLSNLISRNNWIVWQLTQEQRNLEDIFKKLTS